MTTASDAERIARRYPPARTPRLAWLVLAAALGAALLAWTVWAGLHHANPRVAGQVVGFKVVSDTQIDVRVTVQRTVLTDRVTCKIRAQAVTYDTVGELPFTWEPNGEELQTQWITVKTLKRATTATLDSCRAAG